MSDSAIAKDCLVHYDNRHIQVRKDFYDICAYDKSQYNIKLDSKGNKVKDEPNQECMAKILRLLETLTNDRKTQWMLDALRLEKQGLTPPPEPKEYPIELSYGAICHLLYYSHGESTVRNCIAVLLERKYISRYQATKNSIPLYCLQVETLQAILKKQAENAISGVEINSQHQVLKSTAKRLKSTPEMLKSTAQGVEINNNNKDSNKDVINGKKEDTIARESQSPTLQDSAIATPAPLALSSSEQKGNTHELDTVRHSPDTHDMRHIQRGDALDNSRSASGDTHGIAPAQLQTNSTIELTQETTPPTTVGEVVAEKPKRKTPAPSKPVLSEEEQELDQRRKAWQEKINENRGGPLRKAGECINETQCIKALVTEFNDKQIAAILLYMQTEMFPYCKNPHKIGGRDILNESRPVAKLLKERREQTQQGKVTSLPSSSSRQPGKQLVVPSGWSAKPSTCLVGGVRS